MKEKEIGKGRKILNSIRAMLRAIEKNCTFLFLSVLLLLSVLQLNELKKANLSMERANERANEITIDIRFTNAVTLLESNNTTSMLSGVDALHRIAVECSRSGEEQKIYVKLVNDVLCACVRESAKTITDEEGRRERICTRPTVVIQAIIDALFKNKGDIYRKHKSDLSETVLHQINFSKARLTNVRFDFASLQNVWFNDAILSDVSFMLTELVTVVNFNNASLKGVRFHEATLSSINFIETTLTNVWFDKAKIGWTDFYDVTFKNVSFNDAVLTRISFQDRQYGYSKTTFSNVNFTDTKLAGYSYEEIIGNSYELTQ